MANKEEGPVKYFEVQYPAREYTFPEEALIDKVRFDEKYMHVTLADERIISIPLKWIPTLFNAKPEEREKYKINKTKKMIVWDPSECEINDEIRIDDYLRPMGTGDYSKDRHEWLDKYTVDDVAKMVREKKSGYKSGKKKK